MAAARVHADDGRGSEAARGIRLQPLALQGRETLAQHLDGDARFEERLRFAHIENDFADVVPTIGRQFPLGRFEHVRRERNREADRMVNQVLDQKERNPR